MRAEQESGFLDYVAANGERLRRFAYLCCGDWHRAEDAVQTSLVKLYRAWPRVRGGMVDAYVRRIVVNVVISEHRRLWFHRESTAARLPDTAATTVDADRSDQRLTLIGALQSLPRRQRTAVVLRHWEDLPVEETAHAMRCSPGAVRNLTMRGLATLRELLADEAAYAPVLEKIEGGRRDR